MGSKYVPPSVLEKLLDQSELNVERAKDLSIKCSTTVTNRHDPGPSSSDSEYDGSDYGSGGGIDGGGENFRERKRIGGRDAGFKIIDNNHVNKVEEGYNNLAGGRATVNAQFFFAPAEQVKIL